MSEKKKMGRPPLPASERRISIGLRLKSTTNDKLISLSKQANISPGRFLEMLFDSHNIKVSSPSITL